MTMAYMVAPAFRGVLSGVMSVDGSCRPQIVRDDADGEFAALLRTVRRYWGTGAVLNTSLNIHGEPLVHTPAEALSVFTRSGARMPSCSAAFSCSARQREDLTPQFT